MVRLGSELITNAIVYHFDFWILKLKSYTMFYTSLGRERINIHYIMFCGKLQIGNHNLYRYAYLHNGYDIWTIKINLWLVGEGGGSIWTYSLPPLGVPDQCIITHLLRPVCNNRNSVIILHAVLQFYAATIICRKLLLLYNSVCPRIIVVRQTIKRPI